MSNIERINLRLNLDDPIDLKIWNLVKDKKKKGTYIKFLLYNLAINNNLENVIAQDSNKEVKTEESVTLTKEELMDEGIDF
ncbi:hypothetical protein [Clostridium perfringens]|uniref:hypothetical protein n=1 Tax=Clostridium phage phiSM101 TaxID=396359 RepID=UPI0000DB6831|nr:hypothetical protein [Clostridium perfringens]YP_699970.1 hypothetical protein CPR_C0042 [Clostridium phage phiSM101]ABG87908.1 hypothetical protein CPR_C0042 [Clostridium phage phiSM101]MDU7068786.1 hypothetical protein [Clostridium perfringens]SQB59696.1 Uncharacterised protein [Clostridium perfringens]